MSPSRWPWLWPAACASYLVVAETFAPLAECLLFRIAYGPAANRRDALRDNAAIVLANLLSFGAGEIIHTLCGEETVYHPTNVWAGLLIPFSFGVSLFVDSDGYVAGLDGSSVETTAELFQEVSDPGGLSYPHSSSTSASVP